MPESQAYMDLLAFERKLDATIMRKRLDIQEALKRPMKQKRKLRIFISNTFYPGNLSCDFLFIHSPIGKNSYSIMLHQTNNRNFTGFVKYLLNLNILNASSRSKFSL